MHNTFVRKLRAHIITTGLYGSLWAHRRDVHADCPRVNRYWLYFSVKGGDLSVSSSRSEVREQQYNGCQHGRAVTAILVRVILVRPDRKIPRKHGRDFGPGTGGP